MPGEFYDDFVKWLPELMKSDAARARLSEELGIASHRLGVEPSWNDLIESEYATIHDTLLGLVNEDYEVVADLTGYGWYGAFPIEVRSFGSAFFVSAQEFDDSGFFSTASDAESWARQNYHSFLCHEGGNCPICGAPYLYEDLGGEPCGHWLLTFDDECPGNLGENCPLGITFFEGCQFDGKQINDLLGVIDDLLASAPTSTVLARVSNWSWIDPAVKALVERVTSAVDIHGDREMQSDRTAFKDYLESIVNQSDFGQCWTTPQVDGITASGVPSHLWAEDSSSLDLHLCRVVAAHTYAVRCFVAALTERA